ncbi:MAG TPA: VWA domain-containing protein [Terracidiphilus sp.]|nr:VWA domain-containing protein [Terracidiphilus sp.]
MHPARTVLGTILVVSLAPHLHGQIQSAPPNTPTFKITSNLVYLDVTVLDKKGHVVATGLTKDDFTILDNKAPQRIFSFEPPQAHAVSNHANDTNPYGKAPITIFVLDRLNSRAMYFADLYSEMIRYLKAQPATLPSPAEILVNDNKSLEMIQGLTRDRAELLDALKHLPHALPLKMNSGLWGFERMIQSTDALQEIALENEGVPGRKNVIWIGPGGPGLDFRMAGVGLGPKEEGDFKAYAKFTANLLVNARITLYVIYPGIRQIPLSPLRTVSALEDPSMLAGDPFASDMNFGVFALDTGGQYYWDRNFIAPLIKDSLRLATNYYTLTYQPRNVAPDGEFRHVQVLLRNPNLHAVTKAGYYAPDPGNTPPARNSRMMTIVSAVRSTLPLNNLPLTVTRLERHPDSKMVSFTVSLRARDLTWSRQPGGKNSDALLLAVSSMTGYGAYDRITASRMENIGVTSSIRDPGSDRDVVASYPISIRYPRHSRHIRVVVEEDESHRLGAVDLTAAQIAAAPEMPTANPGLRHGRGSK